MKNRILAALCAIAVTASTFANTALAMTHYTGVLLEEYFDDYTGGTPGGFTTLSKSSLTAAEDICGTGLKMTASKGSEVQLSRIITKTNIDLRCLSLSFSARLDDKNAERSVSVRSSSNQDIPLITFGTDGSVTLGDKAAADGNFVCTAGAWYDILFRYNLETGYIRAEFETDGKCDVIEAEASGDIGTVKKIWFTVSAPSSAASSILIDNILLKGDDPVYPTPVQTEGEAEEFETLSSINSWTVNTHEPNEGAAVTCREGRDGNCAVLESYGRSMLELTDFNIDSNPTFAMEFSCKFDDTNIDRWIGIKGKNASTGQNSNTIYFLKFAAGSGTSATASVTGGSSFTYRTDTWYDIKITGDMRHGSFEVSLTANGVEAVYDGTASELLDSVERVYFVMFADQSGAYSYSAFCLDNFKLVSIDEVESVPADGSKNVYPSIGEIKVKFWSDITNTGTVLLNGTTDKITGTKAEGDTLTVYVDELEPNSRYTLSYSGVTDSAGEYNHGRVSFETSDGISVSPIRYKNESGTADASAAGNLSAYFTAGSEENTSLFVYAALYDKDTNSLVDINLKNINLSREGKEYDIYMQIPEDAQSYDVKTGVWNDGMVPVGKTDGTVYERPSGEEVVESIERHIGSDTHPRIHITPSEFEIVKSRINTNSDLRASFNAIVAWAENKINEPVMEYSKDSNSTISYVAGKLEFMAANMGLVYAVTEDEKFADRLYAELESIASYPDWNPYHFLDTAMITSAFAIAYDWMYDYFEKYPAKKDVIVNAVKEKGFEPYLDDYLNRTSKDVTDNRDRSYYWTLTEKPDNWNIVCNSGAIVAAAAFCKELPEYSAQLFDHAFVLLEKAVDRYAPDGAWFEGPRYWGFATRYFCDLLAALNNSAGTDYGFSKAEGVSKSGYFPLAMMGRTGFFNFSDTQIGYSGSTIDEVYYLSYLFGDKNLEAATYNNSGHLGIGYRGILWYRGDGTETADLPLDSYFRDTEAVTMRSSFDDDAAFVGFCAGDNDVPHAHLDIGSFVVEMKGERFVEDLGFEDYSVQKNNVYQWELYRNRAEGHNTLVINPDINPDQREQAFAVIDRFESRSGEAFAVTDMTSAYANDAVTALRGIKLGDGRQTVLVQDEIKCTEPSQVYWFMHTSAEITDISADGKEATLTKNGKSVRAVILSDDGTFTQMAAQPFDSSPVNDSQSTNEGYTKLAIYLENALETTIAVKLIPADCDTASAEVTPLTKW